jgi:hypothetical protein
MTLVRRIVLSSFRSIHGIKSGQRLCQWPGYGNAAHVQKQGSEPEDSGSAQPRVRPAIALLPSQQYENGRRQGIDPNQSPDRQATAG